MPSSLPTTTRYLSRRFAMYAICTILLLSSLIHACRNSSNLGLLCEKDEDCVGGLKCINRQCGTSENPPGPLQLGQLCAAPSASENQNCFLNKNNYCCVFRSEDFVNRGCLIVRYDLYPPEGRCQCKNDDDCPKPMKCCEISKNTSDRGILSCILPTQQNTCPDLSPSCKAPELTAGQPTDEKLDCRNANNNYCCSLHQANGSCVPFEIKGKKLNRCSCVNSNDCPKGMICCPSKPEELARSTYFCAIPNEKGTCENAPDYCSLTDKDRQDCGVYPYCCAPTGKGSCNEFRAFNFFLGKQIKRCSCESDADCPQNTFCCASSLGSKFCTADVKDSATCAGACSYKANQNLDCSAPNNFYCCGKINEACINVGTQAKEEFRCLCKNGMGCPNDLKCCRKGIFEYCSDACP